MEEEGKSEFAVAVECPLEDVKALADESTVQKKVSFENECEKFELEAVNLENFTMNSEDKDDLALRILVVEK